MGLGIKTKLRSLLERKLNRQYTDRLAGAKRRISYEEWLRIQEGQDENGGQDRERLSLAKRCAAAQQQGIRLLREQGILLILQRNGYMEPRAFSWILDCFRENQGLQLLYGDEDVLDAGGEHRLDPSFRPDWSPDTWLSACYLGSVVALRRELIQGLPRKMWPQDSGETLYFEQPGEVRPLVHRLLELAGGFERGGCAIAHLPKLLFHMTHEAAAAGLGERYRLEDRLEWREEAPERRAVTVSVIIPSKDNPETLKQCLDSLRQSLAAGAPTWPGRLEILVVDNGSSPENKAKIEKITHGMKYIYEPAPFNFSKMCNRGAREASGQVLLFLNDDITVCADGWLEAMTDHALRPYTGAVGLKLYYPGSVKIQHAGITNLPGGPVHKLQFTVDGQEEDHGYASLDRNVIGVTGACLMVERERFWRTGGFPEDLQVAYNDVDLCLRLREAGYHNMVVNTFHACHHESLSRGSDLTREKMLRLRRERQILYDRHPLYAERDPYYPEPLCMELGDMRIYGNYLDTRAEPQTISRFRWQNGCPEQEPENMLYKVRLSEDDSVPGTFCLEGYAVVRWDNNACYERVLLLRRQGDTSGANAALLRPGYSREAEYGMQEQPNVAMCGFCVRLENSALPDGCYRIGIQIRNRMGRRRLTAWTTCDVRVRNGTFDTEGTESEWGTERNA